MREAAVGVREKGLGAVLHNTGFGKAFEHGAELFARGHVHVLAPVVAPDAAHHGVGALGLGRGSIEGSGNNNKNCLLLYGWSRFGHLATSSRCAQFLTRNFIGSVRSALVS